MFELRLCKESSFEGTGGDFLWPVMMRSSWLVGVGYYELNPKSGSEESLKFTRSELHPSLLKDQTKITAEICEPVDPPQWPAAARWG